MIVRTFTRQPDIQSRRRRALFPPSLYNETILDSLFLSDFVNNVEITERSISSSIFFSDSFSIIILKSISHLIGFADDFSYPLIKSRALFDFFSINNSFEIGYSLNLLLFQSLSLSEQFTPIYVTVDTISDSLLLSQSFSQSLIYSRSFYPSLAFSDLASSTYKKQLSFSDSLSLFSIANYHFKGIFNNTVPQTLFLSDSFNYERSFLTKTISVQNFLVPQASHFLIYPRFQPIPLPPSNYYTLNNTLLGQNYLNLVYLEFTVTLSLSTRSLLRSYILSHDPEPYTISIENDAWRGFLVNDEVREKYFTDGNVFFRFELEYLGSL